MADIAPGRQRSTADAPKPLGQLGYLLQLDGRKPGENPTEGLPGRPDSKYPANIYDDANPISDPNRLRSVFIVYSYNRSTIGGVKDSLGFSHAAFLVTDDTRQTVDSTTRGVIWDLQRGLGDALFIRENEYEYTRQPLETDPNASQKVGRYEYKGTTDLLTWVIDKYAWNAITVYTKSGYQLTVTDCQQYAKDMVNVVVTNTDGAKAKKMSALANFFINIFGPKDRVKPVV